MGYKAGIRVDQQASWVGLGWDISPGAVVRNVINYPDDYGSSSSTNVELNIAGKTFNRSCGGFLYTEGTHSHSDFNDKYDYKIDKGSFDFGGKSNVASAKIYGYGQFYVSDPTYSPYEVTTGKGTRYYGAATAWGDGNYAKVESNYGEICNTIWVEGGGFLGIDGFKAGYAHIEMELKSKKPYSDIYLCDGETPDIYSLSGQKMILTGKPGSRKFNLQRTSGLATSSTTIDDAIKIQYATNATTGAMTQFVVTGNDGTRQVYCYPLQIKDQISTFVSKEGKKTTISLEKPSTYAWLLTAILSPDYVDTNNNGIPDDEDKGNWIRFEYKKDTTAADWYRFRTPYDNGYTDGPFGGEMAIDGYMELAHLEQIVTPTHVAYFDVVKDDRRDGKEYSESKRLPRLQGVNLYTKASFNLSKPSENIIRSVSFSLNFFLVDGKKLSF